MATQLEQNIDLGLEVLSALVEPGQILTRDVIAEVCGCSVYHIEKLETLALKKFKRRAIQRGLDEFIE